MSQFKERGVYRTDHPATAHRPGRTTAAPHLFEVTFLHTPYRTAAASSSLGFVDLTESCSIGMLLRHVAFGIIAP